MHLDGQRLFLLTDQKPNGIIELPSLCGNNVSKYLHSPGWLCVRARDSDLLVQSAESILTGSVLTIAEIDKILHLENVTGLVLPWGTNEVWRPAIIGTSIGNSRNVALQRYRSWADVASCRGVMGLIDLSQCTFEQLCAIFSGILGKSTVVYGGADNELSENKGILESPKRVPKFDGFFGYEVYRKLVTIEHAVSRFIQIMRTSDEVAVLTSTGCDEGKIHLLLNAISPSWLKAFGEIATEFSMISNCFVGGDDKAYFIAGTNNVPIVDDMLRSNLVLSAAW